MNPAIPKERTWMINPTPSLSFMFIVGQNGIMMWLMSGRAIRMAPALMSQIMLLAK